MAILVALFVVQSRGTGKVAAFFGPIMLAVVPHHGGPRAAPHRRRSGRVLLAFNPYYGVSFLVTHPGIAFAVLGSVFLAVTGRRGALRRSRPFRPQARSAWPGSPRLPGLALNYLGQGALVLSNPDADRRTRSSCWRRDWLLLPLVILATLATIIASQAVITGAFSLTRQAVQLGLLPRLEIRHTSETHRARSTCRG